MQIADKIDINENMYRLYLHCPGEPRSQANENKSWTASYNVPYVCRVGRASALEVLKYAWSGIFSIFTHNLHVVHVHSVYAKYIKKKNLVHM
jgi:hypothetical protein